MLGSGPGGTLARVKGSAVQSSLLYVRERFGDESLARILAAMPEEDGRSLSGVLVSAWYEVDLFRRFMVETERQLRSHGGRPEGLPRRCGNCGRRRCN